MKVLVIGDPHFQISNTVETELFIVEIEKLAQTENPNFIVILGDLLHTHERLHTIPLNYAYKFIDKMRKIALTFVLVGNHDYINNQQFLTENHWMNSLKKWKNVRIVDKVLYYLEQEKLFLFCPYTHNGLFQKALDTSEVNWKTATCIFAHQEFQGCKMGGIVSIDGDTWDEKNPQVISGHIHSKQTLGNVYYCGSSLQTSFVENENIVAIVDFSTNIMAVREVDLKLPRKQILYETMDAVKEIDGNKLGKLSELNKNTKITITGQVYEEFKAFKKTKAYRDLIKNGAKVVFKQKKPLETETMEELNFRQILEKLILKENDKDLSEVFSEIIKNF